MHEASLVQGLLDICLKALDEHNAANPGNRVERISTVSYTHLLASVGGSPFLLPEARLFINAAVLEAIPGGLTGLLVMALATTVFIWLYVNTVRCV